MRRQKLTLQFEYEGHEDIEDTDRYHDLVRAAADLSEDHNVGIWVEEDDARTRSLTVAIFPGRS